MARAVRKTVDGEDWIRGHLKWERVPTADRSKTPIFDALAKDLAALCQGNGDEIMCPMCLARFGRSELKALTKEHVSSKALGGEAVILTCKECNNAAGHKVQGHLKTLLQMNEGFRGDGHFVGLSPCLEKPLRSASK
jgi:hypothetical protein